MNRHQRRAKQKLIAAGASPEGLANIPATPTPPTTGHNGGPPLDEPPLVWRVKIWCGIVQISAAHFYREARLGLIETVHFGRSTRVVTSPKSYVDSKIAQAKAKAGPARGGEVNAP